jgi:hypothetical protein
MPFLFVFGIIINMENRFTKRLKAIEDGKTLPTFEEFFKLCILYNLVECVNLKEMYPTLYEEYKKDLHREK